MHMRRLRFKTEETAVENREKRLADRLQDATPNLLDRDRKRAARSIRAAEKQFVVGSPSATWADCCGLYILLRLACCFGAFFRSLDSRVEENIHS